MDGEGEGVGDEMVMVLGEEGGLVGWGEIGIEIDGEDRQAGA